MSTRVLAAGWTTSSSFMIVAPSLEMVVLPEREKREQQQYSRRESQPRVQPCSMQERKGGKRSGRFKSGEKCQFRSYLVVQNKKLNISLLLILLALRYLKCHITQHLFRARSWVRRCMSTWLVCQASVYESCPEQKLSDTALWAWRSKEIRNRVTFRFYLGLSHTCIWVVEL